MGWRKKIRKRYMTDWTAIGFSSIYRGLTQLEERGLVDSHLEHEGQGATRKVYAINEVGRTVLAHAVLERIGTVRPVAHPFQVGLAFVVHAPREQVLERLQRRGEELSRWLAELGTLTSPDCGSPPLNKVLVLDHAIRHLQTERDFIGRCDAAHCGPGGSPMKQRWMLFYVFCLLCIGTLCIAACNKGAEAETTEATAKPVRVEEVKRGNVAEVLSYPATLRAYNEVRVFSSIPDRILEFPWKDGDEIERGERVALIKKAGMDQGLANMSAQVEGLDAQIENLDSELERTSGLLSAGAVAQSAYDRLNTQLKALRAPTQSDACCTRTTGRAGRQRVHHRSHLRRRCQQVARER